MKNEPRGYPGAGARSPRLLPTLAMVSAVVFWGMSFVSSRVLLDAGFPPMAMVFVRFSIASLVLLPIHRRLEAPARLHGRRDAAVLVLSGLFGVTVYFFCETRGIKLTSASNAALIVATVPVLTVAVDRVLFRHPLSWLQSLGIGLSVLGVFLIVRRSSALFPEALKGNLFMLGACASWVVYIFTSRRLRGRAGGLFLTTWQSVIGVAFLAPLVLLERRQWEMVPGGAPALLASPVVWLNLLYLGIACSAVSYFLYLYALSALGSVVVSSYINLVPVVGAVGGVAVLGERLSVLQVLGAAVVIAGVFLVNLPRRSPEADAPPLEQGGRTRIQ
ncbi:MAG: DMT family transporter [Spirochaetales bacterium]|nr:DMT family transporter [Spirochaetales bacterium]